MDFGFSPEQEMLRASVRKLLDVECPPSLVRAMLADSTAAAPALFASLAELGILGILVPAAHGGQDGTFLDVTVALEEAGKSLVPGPLLTTILATRALAGVGSAAQCRALLPAVARGQRRAACALSTDHRGGADPVIVTAAREGEGWHLCGTVPFVLDAHVADVLVVPARGEAGVTWFALDVATPGITVTPHRTVDMTRRLASVAFDVTAPASAVLGSPGTGDVVVTDVLRHARAALATEAVGVAQRALDLSVAYANTRQQFGRPIGSFQAVKHKCVDMMVGVETARSLAYYAAWTVTEAAPDVDTAVAMAKAYASDVATTVTSEAIQVHGGIGFTWEHDIHLYHRRALAIAAAFGGPVDHRETVAAGLP